MTGGAGLVDVWRTFFGEGLDPGGETGEALREALAAHPGSTPLDLCTGLVYAIGDLGGKVSLSTDQWMGVFVKTETHLLRVECDELLLGLCGAWRTLREVRGEASQRAGGAETAGAGAGVAEGDAAGAVGGAAGSGVGAASTKT